MFHRCRPSDTDVPSLPLLLAGDHATPIEVDGKDLSF
jgi:hypothetical protein